MSTSTSSPVRDRMKEELQSFFGKLLARKDPSAGAQDEAPVDEDIQSHRDVQSEVGTSVSKEKESEFASCVSKSVGKEMDDGNEGADQSGLEEQQVGGLGFGKKGRYQQFEIGTPEQPRPTAPPLEPAQPVPIAENNDIDINVANQKKL